MKRILSLTLATLLAVAYLPASLMAQAQVATVVGTLNGPAGPIANATVQLVNQAGTIVGTGTTTATGGFTLTSQVAAG